MRFGKLLRKERKDREIPQKTLAMKAGLSPAMLWRIETGKELPTSDTAKAFMDALDLKSKTRIQLELALEEDKAEQETSSQDRVEFTLTFGPALSAIINREGIGIKTSELARRLGRPQTTVHRWLNDLLPSAESLQKEIIPQLEELRATPQEIQNLKLAHLHDSLLRALDLSYLGRYEQRWIVEEVMKLAKKRNI